MTIKPALTAEEWERVGNWRPLWRSAMIRRFGPPYEHRAAALALEGQDFGFTWEDVERLRRLATRETKLGGYYTGEDPEYLDDIAERIAALLPPREEDNA